jgi:hypothetical protein
MGGAGAGDGEWIAGPAEQPARERPADNEGLTSRPSVRGSDLSATYRRREASP